MIDGRKVITAPNKVERLPLSFPKFIVITADHDNRGMIVLGGKTVEVKKQERTGIPLTAGVTLILDDITDLYINGEFQGDSVYYSYEKRQ